MNTQPVADRATVSTAPAGSGNPLVRVRGLTVEFRVNSLRRSPEVVHALAGVDIDVMPGEVYGVVGESGSGKTTLARCLLRLIEPTAGTITFDGIDLTKLEGGALRRWRREAQVVFQDPVGALDPRSSVRDIISEPIKLHLRLSRSETDKMVASLLDEVGLGRHHLDRRAHELSGGQCQRVAIARSISLRPRLLILDEPTSSLDVSVQAQILNLLGDLRQMHGLTYMLISHDLSVVRYLADRIGVMYLGRIVEQGSAEEVFDAQLHPYTKALLAAAPNVDGEAKQKVLVHGDPPSSTSPPSGCPFHPRCWLAFEMDTPEICRTVAPVPLTAEPDHRAACHFATDAAARSPMSLKGLPQ